MLDNLLKYNIGNNYLIKYSFDRNVEVYCQTSTSVSYTCKHLSFSPKFDTE